MQKNCVSPFHSELLDFLKKRATKHIEEEGGDQTFSVAFDEELPLSEIIEKYQHIFKDKHPLYIEKRLVEAFNPQVFNELGLGRYFPRVYRGIPRFYHRDFPLESQVKTHFTHIPSLKRCALIRALYSLYSKQEVSGRVTLLTWIINDGLGDYSTALEVFSLLQARFTNVEVRLIALVHKSRYESLVWPQNSIVIPYQDEAPVDIFTPEAWSVFKHSDAILQIPTFYPHFDELKEKVGKKEITYESVGEYGFIESKSFHPKTQNHSMGLHFLEKGILIRAPLHATWDDVKNESLRRLRNPKNHFYLAYLSSEIGGAIYLHALLKSLENDSSDIDLCVPDLDWFLKFADKQKNRGVSLLEWDLGVSSIEIFFEEHFHNIPIQKRGKKVRILCPSEVSNDDFRVLLNLSGNWVGIRGNQSFSEAISQKKSFFYDGKEHQRYFFKDLIALAENRIGEYRGTLECIRGMGAAFLYQLPVSDEEWVDETFFQEVEEWTTIALNLGLFLQEETTHEGFFRFAEILSLEKSANGFLTSLIQRALTFKDHPEIKEKEEENLSLFTEGKKSFKEMIEEQKEIIWTSTKK